ncbi:hypothetical protein MMC13_003096, partial [Lambiella insularis]|nr:hypothetical protein [Lambiella insularis]
MTPKPVDITAFATAQLSLLSDELAVETATTSILLTSTSPSTLSRAGLAILNLVISSQRTGLGGKTVVELAQDSAIGHHGDIGQHGIRVGDIVRVAEQPAGNERKKEKAGMEGRGVEGVVVRVGLKGVNVALKKEEEQLEGLRGRVWVMHQTMETLKKLEERDYTTLMRVLFGLDTPTPLPSGLEDSEAGTNKLEFVNPTLNDSQKDAIRFALASREVALIHGPPGTGKTYTLIELILQLVQRKLRVLVCGPSNISVDNIVERLAPHKLSILRLGHPARLLPSVLNHSLDILTQTSEAAAIVKDVRKEMDDKQASIKKTRNGRERRAIYGELKELRKEFREREKKCVTNLVGNSKVVLTTLHGSGGFQLRHAEFDVVIIDEASQALEAQCWVALLVAKKVILAGDHLQLPPTIKSTNAKVPSHETEVRHDPPQSGETFSLETTLFDRLLILHGPSIKRMLTTQYRMHEKIMRFPSDELYDSKLIAAEAVKARLMTDLPYVVKETEDTKEPLVFWDTQGGDFPERSEEVENDNKSNKSALLGDSKCNEMEAALVKYHIANLIDAGVHAEDIAVVTPYNAQLSILSRELKEEFPGIELGSVDGFQGREKEAIICSLVRSNVDHEVGFLGERRRLNGK